MKKETKLGAMEEWFWSSSFGQNLLTRRRDVELQMKSRMAAFDARAAAVKREEATPALVAQLREAEESYRKVVGAEARKVASARRALDQHVQSIAHDKTRAENVLRETCDPLVAESSDVLWGLMDAREHARTHCTIQHNMLREAIADAKRVGDEPAKDSVKDCVNALRNHEQGEEMVAQFSDAIESIRNLQLELATDLPKAISEITEGLPKRCACCDRKLTLRLSHVQAAEGRPDDIFTPGEI